MYMTCSQASPCVKMTSPRAYWLMVFGTLADSRNVCASNAGPAFATPLVFATPLKDDLAFVLGSIRPP